MLGPWGLKDNELRFTAHMPANPTGGMAGGRDCGREWSRRSHGDKLPALKRRNIHNSCSSPPGSGSAQMGKYKSKRFSAAYVGLTIGALATLITAAMTAAMAESTATPPAPDQPKADAGTATPPPAKPETNPSPKQQPSVAPAKSRSWNFKSQPHAGAAAPSAESAGPPPPPPSGGDEKHPGGVEHAPSGSSGRD